MDFLTSASALELKREMQGLYSGYQALLSESILIDKKEPWAEFSRVFDAVVLALEEFNRFDVGNLLRDVRTLAKCYERAFAARIGKTDRDDSAEQNAIRRRLIGFFVQFGQFIRLDPPEPWTDARD